MSKELVSRLYSTEADVRREAVYRILFDRRHDLVPELKQAAFYEQDEQISLLIAQVAMTLEAFPRDHSLERQILEHITTPGGVNDMGRKMWEYLSTHGSSEMLIAVIGAMAETIPPKAQDFIEGCLNHADPEIRAMACEIAINSGRPTHFAYVLSLITDPDPLVAETAFRVVKELPAEQMNIILDYALGSPDEWVLQNVAPFLPLIITNDMRKVIAKVQYHANPLVAKKAREALKQLDSIPFVSKRLREKHEAGEDDNAGESGEKTEDGEDKLSFKEQMEEKRRKRMEEDQRKRDEDARIEAELGETSPEELEELAGELQEFAGEANGISSEDSDSIPDEDEALVENLDFENELAVLEDIDENVDLDEIAAELDQTEVKLPDEEDGETISAEATAEKTPELDLEAAASDTEIVDFDQVQQELDNVAQTQVPEKVEMPESAEEVESGIDDIEVEIVTIDIEDLAESDKLNEDAEIAATETTSASIPLEADSPAEPVKGQEVTETPAPAPAEQVRLPAGQVKPPAKPKPAKVEEPVPEGAIKIPVIPAAQTILSRYPSFLTEPFANLFKPARPEVHLKNIQLVVDNLIAYLNLCFLQSCMFSAPASEVLTRSVKECLKGHLTGPTSLRCLHNFALAMKQSRENPVFFTFSLANILTESSETNPVMMLRELKEYLKEPMEPLEESLPQAVEGLAEILRGVKAILNNLIVMKAPKGAKEPFADLSGPLAQALSPDRRPGIELPPGEAVVLSRDGTEAFGLFPYFKYTRRRLFFNRPDPVEFKVLLERLEISL